MKCVSPICTGFQTNQTGLTHSDEDNENTVYTDHNYRPSVHTLQLTTFDIKPNM